MSNPGCGITHPLQRDGKSQMQRFLRELNPDYVSVDERSVADLLVFAARMAEKVRFFDDENLEDGNWADFFSEDISTRIALIAVTDTDGIRQLFDDQFELVSSSGLRTDLAGLFEVVWDQVLTIHQWARQVRAHRKFFDSIENQVRSRLRRPFERLVSLDKGAVAIPPDLAAIGLAYDRFVPLWTEDPGSIAPRPDLYGAGPSEAEMVRQGAKRLRTLFNTLHETQLRIVAESARYLEETLDEWPGHNPHMALFITFLLIFRFAQDHLNTLTGRHLDFYYQEVLRLKSRAAEPDQVHLVFQLARNSFVHKLEAETAFKGGKDAKNKEILYALEDEVVLNQGKASLFQTVFVDGKNHSAVHAANIANSGDGKGGDFPNPEVPTWKTFGSAEMPKAEFGMALSSPVLRLAEGRRKITVNLFFEQESYHLALQARQRQLATCDTLTQTLFELKEIFLISLTGEKGWEEVPAEMIETVEWEGTNRLRITLDLDAEFVPVTDYDPEIHTDGLDAVYPAVKILINGEKELHPYGFLKYLELEKVEFKVRVEGIQDLVVQNQVTALKADSAFQPFGNSPTLGFNFYIGSREVFSKELEELKVNVEWDDLPTSFSTHYNLYDPKPTPTTVKSRWSILDGRQWKPLVSGTKGNPLLQVEPPIFRSADFKTDGTVSIASYAPTGIVTTRLRRVRMQEGASPAQIGREPGLAPFKNLNHASQRGFIRLELSGSDLGHGQYTTLLTEQAIKLAKFKTGTAPKLPEAPYTPVIKSISLDYEARAVLDLRYETDTLVPDRPDYEKRIDRFFHIHPAGQQEVHPDTYEAASDKSEKGKKKLHFLPQWEGEGNLYIGISGMDLRQSSSISLLFQVLEGTADPDTRKPEIEWAWLGNNQWTRFESFEITGDTTNGLVTSGLMVFNFPSGATNDNSIRPATYHWIRGTVKNNAAGIADILEVHAQAAVATFADNENTLEHLENPVEAGTVSKMKAKEAQVKSVSQPFASFNGKPAEKSAEFYTRASERLRHKDRAITIWDYETLVLDAFPELYKVKCISHTNKHTQLAPGHVYVVVVPQQVNMNAVDPLKPRASVNTLEEVGRLIRGRSTPFLKLEVQNPDYQEIQLDFRVKFKKGKDVGYYLIQLNEDLKKYLTPWAYSDGADISFEGRIHSSVLLDFVEELPYVEYLTHFKMRQFSAEFPAGNETEEAATTTPMAILVSHPRHLIEAIESEE